MAPDWTIKNDPADTSLNEDLSIDTTIDLSWFSWDTPFKALDVGGPNSGVGVFFSFATKSLKYFVEQVRFSDRIALRQRNARGIQGFPRNKFKQKVL